MKTIRETSDFVCEKLVQKLNLTNNLSILEPSAGEGKIVSYIERTRVIKGLTFDLVELNSEKVEKLKSIAKSNWNIIHGDFLKLDFPNETPFDVGKIYPQNKQYDRIIGCPPFKGNIDLEHIMKMFSLLKMNGIMVTLTSPYWMTNNEPLQEKFREWLHFRDYKFELLPDFTFKEKHKNVPTGILQFFKHSI